MSVEGTGEPVAGALLRAFLGSYSGNPIIDASRDFIRTVRTGADGRYRVACRPGMRSIMLFELLRVITARTSDHGRRISSSPETPRIARNDYTVRRGHAWEFDIRRDDGGPLVDAKVDFLGGNSADLEDYFALSDRSGKAIVTMPPDGRKLIGNVGGPFVNVKPTRHELEFESGFNPDAVRSVAGFRETGSPLRGPLPADRPDNRAGPGKSSRFRITDESGKTAVIGAMVPIEPVVEHGKLRDPDDHVLRQGRPAERVRPGWSSIPGGNRSRGRASCWRTSATRAGRGSSPATRSIG